MTKSNEIEKCTKILKEHTLLSPIGKINILTCSIGLHQVKMEKDLTDENFSPPSPK